MSNIVKGSDLHAQLCCWPVNAGAEHLGLTPAKAMQLSPLIICYAQLRAQHDYDSVLVMGKVSLHNTRSLMLLCYLAAITESGVTHLAQYAHTL